MLVHGFTQTGASWDRVARRLERDFEVVVADLPGHGRSPIPDAGSGLGEAARALGSAGGRAAYVGYSLGGRCCLHLALEAPRLVERLVLVGAHPGIEDAPARRLRRESDDELAAQLERGGDAALPAFVESWLAGPLFAHLSDEQADRSSRLYELRRRAGGVAADRRDRHPGAAVGPARRARHAGARRGGRARRQVQRRSPRGRSRPSAPTPGSSSWPAPATRSPFERPDAFVALVREFLGTGPTHRGSRRGDSQRDPQGEQGAEGELKGAGPDERRDEVTTLGATRARGVAAAGRGRRRAAPAARAGRQKAMTTTSASAPITQAA